MANIRSQLGKYYKTPKSESERYMIMHEAWNAKNLTERVLAITNEQMIKMSQKDYATLVEIGNKLYPSKGIK